MLFSILFYDLIGMFLKGRENIPLLILLMLSIFFKLKEEKKKDSKAQPGNTQDECLVLCSTGI